MTEYLIGVDLGQAQDFTALVVLEVAKQDTGKIEPDYQAIISKSMWTDRIVEASKPIFEKHYTVRHIDRLPIGTPYPEQVRQIAGLVRQIKQQGGSSTLVVDQTGVGRPVLDMLKTADLNPRAITITGGDTVTKDRQDYRVPKRDLVSTAQVLLQSQRLKIVRSLDHAGTLVSELQAFKVSVSLKGHDSYGNDVGQWRENPHDDLVLALALACWYGENPPRVYPSLSSVSFPSF